MVDEDPAAYSFPDPRKAPWDAPLAWGGDLSPGRLLKAYTLGIFPWYDAGQPILWWSPDPRFVLNPKTAIINRGLRRALKKSYWHVTFDHAFERVMRACAQTPRPGQSGTWITEPMVEAYCKLHQMGYAHSVECWVEGVLVGGLYGISLGRAFFGESMFHHKTDASKVAFATLLEQLVRWDFEMVDCQMPTAHLASFGAREISRDDFLDHLEHLLTVPARRGSWSLDSTL